MADMELNVPDGWESNKLGAICKIKKGVQFNRIELSDAGMYPCINGGVTPSGYSDLWNTEAETITISEGGNSCGYVNYLTSKFWSGGHCYSLLDLKKGLDKGFLYQALKGRESLIMDLRVGSGLPNIQQKAIKEFNLSFPESATEQRQIARILSKADEAISQTEQLIAKYRRLKTGLMQDLLTKGIDAHGNIRSEETHAFKDSPLGRIPVEWEVETLEGLLDNIPDNMRSGPFGSALTKSEWVALGIPYLGIDNVQKEKFVQIYNRHISPRKYTQLARYSVNPFDVMITIMGTVGRSCVVPEGIGRAISSKHVWTMSFDRNKYFPELISYQLNYSPWILKAMREDTQGGVMPSINSRLLKKLKFPVPSIHEQKLIAKKYAAAQAFLGQLNNSLSKLNSLKAGLMQDLLSGKVRVGQLIAEAAVA